MGRNRSNILLRRIRKIKNGKDANLIMSKRRYIYTLKVGAITADEVMYAEGKYDSNNTSYYLYDGQSYWTMSPYGWESFLSSTPSVFYVNENGSLNNAYVRSASRGIRPVINLRSDITFSSGDGSQNDPYVVSK